MDMIGFYAAFTGTANNQANIPVPRRCRLRGISFFLTADLDADLESFFAELSLLPVFQTTTNNTRNCLFSVGLQANLTTSGAIVSAVSGFQPMDIQLDPLQILYLNGVMNGTTAGSFGGQLHIQ